MRIVSVLPLVVSGLLFVSGSHRPQEILTLDPERYCAAQPGPVLSEAFVFDPTDAAESAIREILKLGGLSSRRVQLQAANIDGAAAYLDAFSGERMILYDEKFIRDLTDESDSFWASRAILAHELGHHVNAHLEGTDSTHRRIEELEADRYAGHVLFNLGASLDATKRVFSELREGGDYPPNSARIAAAENGWWAAREQSGYLDESRDTFRPSVDTRVDAVIDAGKEPPTDWTASTVVGLSLQAHHSGSVVHVGGGPSGPGFEFSVQGSLEYAREANVQVIVHFTFADGRAVFAHPAEMHYRTVDDHVATGSERFVPTTARLNLETVRINPMPYYALNLVPIGFRTDYLIIARVAVSVDGILVATSSPVQLRIRW